MTRNELIAKLEQLAAQRYPDKPENDIRKAVNALYANKRYQAAQYLESEKLEDLATECVQLGNLSVSNF